MPVPALSKTRLLALAVVGLVAATPALAHHPMGGATPATFFQGLLSGFGHPVIGIDHFAALIGVGLLSSRFANGLSLPMAWIVAMAAGVGAHLGGIDLPLTEVLVALSVVAIGVVAALRPTLSYSAAALLFAAGGLIHGYALAESIIGAESTPLVAYLAGLVAVQAALTMCVAYVARRLSAAASPVVSAKLRLAGLAVAATGAATLALALPSIG